MRTQKAIEQEAQITEDKVWYGRHQSLMEEVYPKELKDPKVSKEKKGFIRGGIKAAKEMETKYGKKNLGFDDDFEWGEMCGRLETLRWVLGDEWGNLDT